MTSFIGGSSVPSDRYPARLDVRLTIPARELFGAAPNAEIPDAGGVDCSNRPTRAGAPGQDPSLLRTRERPKFRPGSALQMRRGTVSLLIMQARDLMGGPRRCANLLVGP